jgi:hypothetical protein
VKTFKQVDEAGNLVAFEVSSVIGRWHICRFIEQRFPNTALTVKMGDSFAVFELDGRSFEILEPWGDSSRYHLAEKSPRPSVELNLLEAAVADYRPNMKSIVFSLFSSASSLKTMLLLILVAMAVMVASVLSGRR